jgi:hypothetical protein
MRPCLLLLLALAGCTVDGDGTCSSDRPPARSGATAVLVPPLNQLFVYGGRTEGMPAVWSFRFGNCPGWHPLPLASVGAPIAASPAGAFDDHRHRIVYPGSPTSHALDTDSSQWRDLLTTGTPPTLTDHAWAVFDPDHDRLVVGGFGSAQLSFAASDQGAWQPFDFLNAPVRVETVTAAVDPTRSTLYAFDGAHALLYRYPLFVDRPADNALVTIGGDALPVDHEAHLGWNAVDEHLYLVGASGDSAGAVYRLDARSGAGDTLDVHRLAPAAAGDPHPPARAGAAFGMSGNFAVLFAGATTTSAASACALDDTWSFSVDDARWTALLPATTCL